MAPIALERSAPRARTLDPITPEKLTIGFAVNHHTGAYSSIVMQVVNFHLFHKTNNTNYFQACYAKWLTILPF